MNQTGMAAKAMCNDPAHPTHGKTVGFGVKMPGTPRTPAVVKMPGSLCAQAVEPEHQIIASKLKALLKSKVQWLTMVHHPASIFHWLFPHSYPEQVWPQVVLGVALMSTWLRIAFVDRFWFLHLPDVVWDVLSDADPGSTVSTSKSWV